MRGGNRKTAHRRRDSSTDTDVTIHGSPRKSLTVAIRVSDMARWADEAREKRTSACGTRLAMFSVDAPDARLAQL